MLTYKKVEKVHTSTELDKIICDVCKREWGEGDYRKQREIINIEKIFTYFDSFGEMAHICFQICPDCLKKHLGQFIELEEDSGA